MKLTVPVSPTHYARLKAIAAARRCTVDHLTRELVPLYLAALAGELEPARPRRLRAIKGGRP